MNEIAETASSQYSMATSCSQVTRHFMPMCSVVCVHNMLWLSQFAIDWKIRYRKDAVRLMGMTTEWMRS